MGVSQARTIFRQKNERQLLVQEPSLLLLHMHTYLYVLEITINTRIYCFHHIDTYSVPLLLVLLCINDLQLVYPDSVVPHIIACACLYKTCITPSIQLSPSGLQVNARVRKCRSSEQTTSGVAFGRRRRGTHIVHGEAWGDRSRITEAAIDQSCKDARFTTYLLLCPWCVPVSFIVPSEGMNATLLVR